MRIRKFRKEDSRKVSNCIRLCLKQVNSKDYPESVINYMVDYFSPKTLVYLSENRKAFVAFDQDELLGTGSLEGNEIHTLFVKPKHFDRGVGKKLMTKLESEAKKDNYSFVKLSSSLTAIDFYLKLGYKKVSEKNSKNFGRSIIMRRRI